MKKTSVFINISDIFLKLSLLIYILYNFMVNNAINYILLTILIVSSIIQILPYAKKK
jgi:hypothetical protein